MITKYLPTFHQVEPSNLLGLTMGWVVAQRPVKHSSGTYSVATVEKNGIKFIENGVICSLDADGKVVNYVEGKQAFLHYTEELNTFLDAKKYFAVECEGDDTYLRLVALVPGSEFVTDNYSLQANVSSSEVKYATISNGALVADKVAPTQGTYFAASMTTLPNGGDAICVKVN